MLWYYYFTTISDSVRIIWYWTITLQLFLNLSLRHEWPWRSSLGPQVSHMLTATEATEARALHPYKDYSLGYGFSIIKVNTLRPRQNGRHFAVDTFNSIFVNENVRILITFSLKFVPKGSINNIPALVQKMAWRRWGDKPLSEPMMVRLPTHICVTRPQWVKMVRKQYYFYNGNF